LSLVYSQKFILKDSIVIQPSQSDFIFQDADLIGNQLWCRFDNWTLSGNFIQLVNQKGRVYTFSTQDSSILTEFGSMSPWESGFVIPKYFGSGRLMCFDTIHSELQIQNEKTYKKRGLFDLIRSYPNRPGIWRNDIYFHDSLVLCNSISSDIDPTNNQRMKRTLRRTISDTKIFMLYNINSKQIVRLFGGFPSFYLSDTFNVANMQHSFAIDWESGNIYTTFGADNNIMVYNASSKKVINWYCPGKYLRQEKLKLPVYNRSLYALRDVYNLFLDSYSNMYFFKPYIFRVYDNAIESDSVMQLLPENAYYTCVPMQIRKAWFAKQLEKKKFLQQIDENGKIKIDLPFPHNMNTFVGCTEGKYYFRKLKLVRNEHNAKIYEYEVSE